MMTEGARLLLGHRPPPHRAALQRAHRALSRDSSACASAARGEGGTDGGGDAREDVRRRLDLYPPASEREHAAKRTTPNRRCSAASMQQMNR